MGQLHKNLAQQDSFVPVIDIAPYFSGTPEGKHRAAQQIGRACREVGFYVIVGHGVDPNLVEQVEIISREFFDLPLEEKMRLHVGKEPGAVGYAAIGDTALAYTRGQVAPPDLNESFQVAKVDAAGDPYFQSEAARGLVPKNRWPERPAASPPRRGECGLRGCARSDGSGTSAVEGEHRARARGIRPLALP